MIKLDRRRPYHHIKFAQILIFAMLTIFAFAPLSVFTTQVTDFPGVKSAWLWDCDSELSRSGCLKKQRSHAWIHSTMLIWPLKPGYLNDLWPGQCICIIIKNIIVVL